MTKAAQSPSLFNQSELQILHRTALALLREAEYGELTSALLDIAIEAMGADRGCIVAHDQGEFRATVSRNFFGNSLENAESEVSSTIAAQVVAAQRAILVDDAMATSGLRDRSSIRRFGVRSLLCAPLISDSEAFAVVYLENRGVTSCFTARHERLLSEICAMATPRLKTAVELALAKQRADELLGSGDNGGIVTCDTELARLLEMTRQVAKTDLPILIQGETGTGKELLARALLRHSQRAHGPFVVLNCGAIPATLIESELFGSTRGAFTGATHDRIGMIAAANRGTLFLDEIGELPLEMQPRLLRVLQSGEFNRLGSTSTETVDVRVIAATNKDVADEAEAGNFRRDLYYRIAAVTLQIPPLRERRDDIALLAEHFLRSYARRQGKQPPQLQPKALELLRAYRFPGNVRQLEFEMARLVALTPSGAAIGAEMLSESIRNPDPQLESGSVPVVPLSEMERRLIRETLLVTKGNRTQAAEMLGISREGLRTKMLRLGLT